VAINWTYWPSDPTYGDDTWSSQPPWIRPARPGSISWALRRTVDPVAEPVDLATAKAHLRLDIPDDDVLVQNLISAARESVEMQTGIAMLQQTWQLYLDRWPRAYCVELWPSPGVPLGAILLSRKPVQSVASVTWYGSDGSTNVVPSTAYTLDSASRPARVVPAINTYWPSMSLVPSSGVVVQFVAGYADAAHVPATLKQAMLLTIGHWYEHRESVMAESRGIALVLPQSAQALIGMHRSILVG